MQNKLTSNLTPIRSGVNLAVAVLLVAGLSMVIIPASASVPANDIVKAKVNPYLLERENGVQRVYVSLEKQAAQACRSGDRASLRKTQLSTECTANLLNDFVLDLNDARVTAYHSRAIAQ